MALEGVARRQLVIHPRFATPSFASRTLTTHTHTTTHQRKSTAASAPPRGIDRKWLSLIKRRVGKCMTFGLQPEQVAAAGRVLRQIARDWRELVAGSEGFLTGETRRGLYRHNVIWGEMVFYPSCVCYFGYT